MFLSAIPNNLLMLDTQTSQQPLPALSVEPGAICLIGFTWEQCSLWRCRLFVSVYFIAFIHVYKDSISLVSHQSLLTPNLPVVPQLDPQVSTTPWLLLPPLGATIIRFRFQNPTDVRLYILTHRTQLSHVLYCIRCECNNNASELLPGL